MKSAIKGFFLHIADISDFIKDVFVSLKDMRFYRQQLEEQFYVVGVTTIPIVVVIAVFIGMVTAIQTKHQTYIVMPYTITVDIIFKSIILELGPVITGLILAGRLGAGFAAQIGSMKITRQIDALFTLSVNPIGFLSMPRVVASTLLFPLLTVISNVIALIGSFVIVVFFWNITSGQFTEGIIQSFSIYDLFVGLLKAMSFGFIVGVVGTYHGFITEEGAKGVGVSAVRSVVYASVGILIADYIIAQIFLGGV